MRNLKKISEEEAELVAMLRLGHDDGRYRIIYPRSVEDVLSFAINKQNIKKVFDTIPVEKAFVVEDIIESKMPGDLDDYAEVASFHAIETITPFLEIVPSNRYKLKLNVSPVKYYYFINNLNLYLDIGCIDDYMSVYEDAHSLKESDFVATKEGKLSVAIVGRKSFLHYVIEPVINIEVPRLFNELESDCNTVEAAIHETIHAIVQPMIIKSIIGNLESPITPNYSIQRIREDAELFAYSLTPYLTRDIIIDERYFENYKKKILYKKKIGGKIGNCDYGQVLDVLINEKSLEKAFERCISVTKEK